MSPFSALSLTARVPRSAVQRVRLRLDRLEDRTVPNATVAAVKVNDGSGQRSEVRSITTTFSDPVMFAGGTSNAAAAFRLRRITDGADVALSAAVATDGSGRTVVTLAFSGAATDRVSTLNGGIPSLADGAYTFTVLGHDILGPNFQLLDGSGAGIPGSNFVSPTDTIDGGPGQLRMYRLYGDVNGDGVVDQTDLGAFRQAFNSAAGQPGYLAYLDAFNTGAVDAQDLGQFRLRFNVSVLANVPPPGFYVNPATGNDSNDGRTPAKAWKTWDKLVSAVADGTITGGHWVADDGSPADISSIPTDATKESWYAAYLLGQRTVTGAHIYIDTSAAPLQITNWLVLPAGCEIESATNSLTDLRVNVPIAATETWTRPEAGTAPDVWGTTSSSYALTGLYEQVAGQWAQLLPIGWDGAVPTLAAALPKLQAAPGSFYVDPATNRLYTHALAGGNPNSDGVSRQYVPAWVGAASRRLVEVTGGLAYKIGGDGGFGFDPTNSQAQGASGIGAGEWSDISIIDSCQWSRAGKHTFSAVGSAGYGFAVFRNDTAEEGPGHVFVGYWTHFVDYTSFSGTGSVMSIYDGDTTVNGWANVGTPGGSDANPNYLALIAHSNDATPAFSERLIENCNFGGTVSLGGPETALAEMRDTVLGGTFSTEAATSVVDRSKVAYRFPIFDGATATVTDSIFVPGTLYTSSPSDIQGTVTLNRCTIDLTQGNNYSTAWTRVAALNLAVTNSVILNRQNAFYGLVSGPVQTDSLAIDHSLIEGSPGSIQPGITVTNTLFVADAMLDPTTYVPMAGSPAIGQSIPVNNAPDYTGEIWATRRTAGALEFPSPMAHPRSLDGTPDPLEYPPVALIHDTVNEEPA